MAKGKIVLTLCSHTVYMISIENSTARFRRLFGTSDTPSFPVIQLEQDGWRVAPSPVLSIAWKEGNFYGSANQGFTNTQGFWFLDASSSHLSVMQKQGGTSRPCFCSPRSHIPGEVVIWLHKMRKRFETLKPSFTKLFVTAKFKHAFRSR